MIYHLYRRPKKNGVFWMDLRVNGCRYREPLGTRDKNEAGEFMQKRIEQLKSKAPDPAKRAKSYGSMDIKTAIAAYIVERRHEVSPRMVAYWQEQEVSLSAHFKTIKLRRLTAAHVSDYQRARLDAGKAAKTINGAVSVLRQLLKHAKLWYRFAEDYKPISNRKPPVGRALSPEEQKRLFETAALWKPEMPKLVKVGKDGKTYKTRPGWMYAHTAATLAFFCGMRSCEIKGLRWQDVDFTTGTIEIKRSKTAAGHRKPSLNDVCRQALANLFAKATLIGASNTDHYVFPSHITVAENGIKLRKIDPTRPITSWRSAWRSIRKEAGLQGVRFHDGRHTTVTTLCEKGVPDWVIQAQVGHVSPDMMKTYSHIRRQALNAAAAALEPNYSTSVQVELVN